MAVRKLKGFEQWSHLGFDGKLIFRKPIDIPFVTYSNHVPCYEANAYIHKLIVRNLKSDTIRGYAHDIIHLVHFIEKQPLLSRFSQLTDATFTLFIQSLQAERTPLGELKRRNNSVIKIAHTCLDFLQFVQDFHDLSAFIGKDKSNSIQMLEKPYKRKQEGYKGFIEGVKVTHTAVPTKDEIKKRHPVSEDDALRVWEFIKNQKNKDKRRRDMALYTAMEQLGGRVSELHLIKMSDYEEARRTGMLTLTTLKRRDDKTTRKIPVPHLLLSVIADYIKVRKKSMRKKKVQHDYLFISLTTGQPLSADSWTTYMNAWKKKLGIEGELHPHLWRHAFSTDKLKELILAAKEVNDKDDFRKHLLHTQTFKMQLQQWTGHTNLSSLDTYIDLAFADIHGYTEVYNAVSLKSSVELAKRQIELLEEQIARKELTSTAALVEIKILLEAFQSDIDKSIIPS
ncbi:tyrosine-type recombinase/integrase [Vibrio parahaemolyticus]|uniref:tyrosine-type recombinase/integrase n=1 Tax=Vibrio parahaemolyticus TaxID=670 RepID=UPI00084BBFF3|nr:tyrosine-type recombinase/integrase [Vibrio parahaemolyticus]EGQ7919736.1 tyrosine-type recombinase/integrase [Vibrio parahaemolyticus]EGQ9944402.1 tyrosine-type recombinase/integrase [Vibrio parahaemolyticus]EJL7426814.1 tyrosine-type recombinase/integrase [Vibrio parahaemolyticus]ELA7073547.1 tyrosine-type recombinase/integrase [Vibrio parahaemolyticus]ELI1803629.1 tyrosine-type recombinase/integrase [Vibrio parahaemolyticus]